MTETVVQFHGRVGAKPTNLFPVERTRDALSDWCKRQAPRSTRKWVEQRFDLSEALARTVVEGSASAATLDHCWTVGGWGLVLEVFTVMFGEDISQHLQREKRRHEEQAARLASLAGAVRPFRSSGGADPADLGAVVDRLAPDRRRRVGEDAVR